jgi:hypothetical protein
MRWAQSATLDCAFFDRALIQPKRYFLADTYLQQAASPHDDRGGVRRVGLKALQPERGSWQRTLQIKWYFAGSWMLP